MLGYRTLEISYIAKSLVAAGFRPTFGIHHDNQLNAFNLADDLIEAYRAIVNIVAHNNIGSSFQKMKQEKLRMYYIMHV